MSRDDSPRTEPVVDERIDARDRFAGRLDSYVEDDESGVSHCSWCGSDRLDGWMTEGAQGLVARCVECAHVDDVEEGDRA
jgi:hypothetical protein